MKLIPLFPALLILLFALSGCTQKAGTALTSVDVRTPVPTPKLELIPIVIGETPATAASANVGTWEAKDFTISSQGNISGNLEIILNRPVAYSYYQDVLVIQVWAYYVWPQYGDTLLKPAGEFIPIRASKSTDTSSTFIIKGQFDIPPLMLEIDGGMPLQHFEVPMVWYRLTQGYASYQAKIGSPENYKDWPWSGSPIFNQTLFLNGKIDTQVRGGLDYSKWFAENIFMPTNIPNTPIAYPEPGFAPSLVPVNPYPINP